MRALLMLLLVALMTQVPGAWATDVRHCENLRRHLHDPPVEVILCGVVHTERGDCAGENARASNAVVVLAVVGDQIPAVIVSTSCDEDEHGRRSSVAALASSSDDDSTVVAGVVWSSNPGGCVMTALAPEEAGGFRALPCPAGQAPPAVPALV